MIEATLHLSEKSMIGIHARDMEHVAEICAEILDGDDGFAWDLDTDLGPFFVNQTGTYWPRPEAI